MLYETPILAYHDIGQARKYPGGDFSPAVLPMHFNWQMEYLATRRYKVISVDEFLYNCGSVKRRQLVLTFDDGFDNFYTDAYPVLRRFNFPAVVFVITDCIDKQGWLSAEQIKEIADNGVTIASHTKSHSYLPSLKDEDIKMQVIDSKRILEDILKKSVDFLSYPNGGFTPLIQTIVRRAGYTAAFTTNRSIGWRFDPYAIRRVKMTNHSSNSLAMWAKLSGYYSQLKQREVAREERICR